MCIHSFLSCRLLNQCLLVAANHVQHTCAYDCVFPPKSCIPRVRLHVLLLENEVSLNNKLAATATANLRRQVERHVAAEILFGQPGQLGRLQAAQPADGADAGYTRRHDGHARRSAGC